MKFTQSIKTYLNSNGMLTRVSRSTIRNGVNFKATTRRICPARLVQPVVS